ncbi:UNVERIFIED_ORG: hypothetical protein DFS12_10151 [Chitinophaga ginsengisegetis]|nr:hypothetical protein [Chitinophaga ginsengisegetis]MDR6644810.1 hypothetical protein [Chitinophaga ginsengisegetis]MDR6652598.1 hypothetical protein [Chitinophaga ginsengisegetis]
MLPESRGSFDSTIRPECYNSVNITANDLTALEFKTRKTGATILHSSNNHIFYLPGLPDNIIEWFSLLPSRILL